MTEKIPPYYSNAAKSMVGVKPILTVTGDFKLPHGSGGIQWYACPGCAYSWLKKPAGYCGGCGSGIEFID